MDGIDKEGSYRIVCTCVVGLFLAASIFCHGWYVKFSSFYGAVEYSQQCNFIDETMLHNLMTGTYSMKLPAANRLKWTFVQETNGCP